MSGSISQKTIQEVRERSDILLLVGEATQLKRSGSRYFGLCPFHSEKSPSFYVRPEDNSFHCFGCGASGNAISFVMKSKGLGFPEAIEDLAGRFGVEIIREGNFAKQSNQGTSKFYEINLIANEFFQASLQTNKLAQEYLAKRGLEKSTLKDLAIGFAPKTRDTLSRILQAKGFSLEQIISSGLARKSSNGNMYDLFSGRIIFPIFMDPKRISAFGGRMIPELFTQEESQKVPKYLNSPETPVYFKSKTLYGLIYAAKSAQESAEIYVVEGYMDFASLYQAGIRNVVATCGTSLTNQHVQVLSRVSKRILILFDGDKAGRSAAARSFKAFSHAPVDVWAVFLEEEEDPDTFVRRYGKEAKVRLSKLNRIFLFDVYLNSLIAEHKVDSIEALGPSSKISILKKITAELNNLGNDLLLNEYLRRTAFLLKLPEDDLTSLSAINSANTELKKENTVKQKEEESPSGNSQINSAQTIKSIDKLPRVDKEILSCIILLKKKACEKIIGDNDVLLLLEDATVLFIQKFYEILLLHDEALDRDDLIKKNTISLLKSFGTTWVQHWKNSYVIYENKTSDPEKAFAESIETLKRKKLQQLISDLKELRQNEQSLEQKAFWAQKQIDLEKTLKN